jgi:peptide chain release factor 3
VLYDEIPRFPPETFSYLHNPNTAKYKRFRDGLQQLLQEGVIQQFEMNDSFQKIPLLAAVGPLQFEVVQYRLESEYGAESRFEPTPYSLARWYRTADGSEPELSLPFSAALATDLAGQKVVLFQDEWSLKYFLEKNEELEVSEIPFK